MKQSRKITRAVRLCSIGDDCSDRTLRVTKAIGGGSHRHRGGLIVPVRIGDSGAQIFQKSIKLLNIFCL